MLKCRDGIRFELISRRSGIYTRGGFDAIAAGFGGAVEQEHGDVVR